MNRLKTILALCTLTVSGYAQTKEFKITPEQSKIKVAKYQHGFTVYDASYGSIDFPIFDTIYTEREEYKKIRNQVESLKADSVALNEEYNAKLKQYNQDVEVYNQELAKYNEIKTINKKIEEFQRSREKFNAKKGSLKDAQMMIDKYNLGHLVYADRSVNKSRLKDFLLLRFDKTAMHNHLNQVKGMISEQNQKPKAASRPLQILASSYTELTNTREKLRREKRYNVELKQTGTYPKDGLMLGEQIKDLTTISGTFKVIGEYYQMGYTYGGYVEKQLVEKKVVEENKLKNYTIYGLSSLMKDESTGKLLYGSGSFLYNCGTDMTVIRFIEKLNKLGYKTEEKGDDIFIFTSKAKLALTPDIYKNVEAGNTGYINEMARSVAQFNRLLDKAIPLTDKMVKHFSAYQKKTISSSRLSTWKNDVRASQKIFKSMGELPGRDLDNLFNYQKHISSERLQKSNDFWQVLKGSETILGM